jgi:hypothetical protein
MIRQGFLMRAIGVDPATAPPGDRVECGFQVDFPTIMGKVMRRQGTAPSAGPPYPAAPMSNIFTLRCKDSAWNFRLVEIQLYKQHVKQDGTKFAPNGATT